MKYEIKGNPFPVLIMNLENGESVKTERGAMSWMSPNMEMSTNAGGSIGKMFSRAFSGESMFQNRYTALGGQGMIAMASSFPGEIVPFDVSKGPIIAQKRSFIASEENVEMSIFFQKRASSGFFGGEGFIMQKFSGNGMVFLEIDGSVITYDLAPGQSMIVDTGTLVAMEETCQMELQKVKGAKNIFFGGEGLFNTKITGPGRIYLQTMTAFEMAQAIIPYIPSSK